MPEPVPHIVQRVPVVAVQEPIGDAVPERVRTHRLAILPAGVRVRPNLCAAGEPLDHVVDALAQQPVGLLGREQRGAAILSGREVRPERPNRAEVALGVERDRRGTRAAVGGVVLLDMPRDAKQLVVEVEQRAVD